MIKRDILLPFIGRYRKECLSLTVVHYTGVVRYEIETCISQKSEYNNSSVVSIQQQRALRPPRMRWS